MPRTDIAPSQVNSGNGGPRPAPSVSPPVSRRPPSRNRARVAAGVILLAVSALAAVLLYGDLGDRRPVLAAARPVAAGQVIQDSDLREVRVATDSGVGTVPAAGKGRVVGRPAAVALVPGGLLTAGQLADGPVLPSGSAVIGATLKPGQFPGGLRSGDSVLVVVMPAEELATSVETAPPIPVRATVVATDRIPDSSGAVSISLAVPSAQASGLAVGGARGRLALVLEPR